VSTSQFHQLPANSLYSEKKVIFFPEKMIAEKPSWVRHEGMQIFSIDVQPGGLRFATGGGDHKVCV
jgi:hypothetical protein